MMIVTPSKQSIPRSLLPGGGFWHPRSFSPGVGMSRRLFRLLSARRRPSTSTKTKTHVVDGSRKSQEQTGSQQPRNKKNVLLFLRKHHQFFGWIVVAGAVGHMVFFFPILSTISVYEEVTGFIAIGILALSVILGMWLWIESSWRKRRMPKAVHTLHAALTIAFFLVLFLHI